MSGLTHTKIPTAFVLGRKNAYSWNPLRGCDNYSCPLHPQNKGGCWAARICNRMAGPWAKSESCYRRDVTDAPDGFSRFSRNGWTLAAAAYDRIKCNMMHFEPTWFQSQFDKKFPKERSCILACYQTDLAFAPGKWTGRIINKINENNKERKAAGLPLHIFPFLTKAPGKLYPFFEWPENCWLGYTAIDDEKYFDSLQEMMMSGLHQKNIIYFYLEPLQGNIDLRAGVHFIDWIIVGGGPDPLNPEWVRSIRDQCEKAGIPFYFKGWGNTIWFMNQYWTKREFNKMKKNNNMWWVYWHNEIDGATWEQFPEEK